MVETSQNTGCKPEFHKHFRNANYAADNLETGGVIINDVHLPR